MDKYHHVDIFEDPRIEVQAESKVITSLTNILQLTGMTLSGFVGVSTFLLVMISSSIVPPPPAPLRVQGVTTTRTGGHSTSGNISRIPEKNLFSLSTDSEFRVFPLPLRVLTEDVKIVTDEFEDRGVIFRYDPSANIGAAIRNFSLGTLEDTDMRNREAPRGISMEFGADTTHVGFYIQSGDTFDSTVLREARPVTIVLRDSEREVLFHDTLSTCPFGMSHCSANFIGLESDSFITSLELRAVFPYSFALSGILVERSE